MEITLSFAKKLISNYKQNHWSVINGGCASLHQNPSFPNVVDARSVWFSLQDLQNFINLITTANDSLAKGQQPCDGVRVYFGEYSIDLVQQMQQTLTDPNEINYLNSYVGLHTLVMVPTTPGSAPYHHCDCDLNGNTFTSANDNNVISALNHGHLTPPPYVMEQNASYSGPKYYDPAVGNTLMIYADLGQ